MRVFVTGATGYIGRAVTEALARAGHQVEGLARSDESAGRLEEAGHAVRRGALDDAEALAAGARGADAVIHLGSTGKADAGTVDAVAVSALVGALAGSGKPFIYTSGVWVLGDTDGVADEDHPLDAAAIVAWRPAVERAALDAAGRGVGSVVIRPAVVYGRGGGTPGMLSRAARSKGVARYVGDGTQRWSFVHVDDLADLYVRALSAPAGTVLNAAAGAFHTAREVAEAAAQPHGARAEAWPLEEARAAFGPFADALALDQRVSGERARALLGWAPSGVDVLDELRTGSYAPADGAA